MILKIGYWGKEGINGYKYFPVGDTEFSINPMWEGNMLYKKDEDKIVARTCEREWITLREGEIRRMFNGAVLEFDMQLTEVLFWDKGGTKVDLGCIGGTVFVMNDNGKTVDKY